MPGSFLPCLRGYVMEAKYTHVSTDPSARDDDGMKRSGGVVRWSKRLICFKEKYLFGVVNDREWSRIIVAVIE